MAVADALRLASAAGARAVVVGQVSGGPDTVTIFAATYDVATGQLVRETQQTGPARPDSRPLFDALARDILGAAAGLPAPR